MCLHSLSLPGLWDRVDRCSYHEGADLLQVTAQGRDPRCREDEGMSLSTLHTPCWENLVYMYYSMHKNLDPVSSVASSNSHNFQWHNSQFLSSFSESLEGALSNCIPVQLWSLKSHQISRLHCPWSFDEIGAKNDFWYELPIWKRFL